MADVTLTYQGDTILELSETGNKIIETAGKYCEADILLEYVKSGGGSFEGLQLVSVDPSTEIPTGYKWNGNTIPSYGMHYFAYGLGNGRPCVVDFSEVEYIGAYALEYSGLEIINAANVKEIGSFGLAFRLAKTSNDLTGKTLNLASYTGYGIGKNSNVNSILRPQDGNNFYGTVLCPKIEHVPQYCFYGVKTDLSVQLGGVGYPVKTVGGRPFGGSMTGTNTVTVYTTGSLLPTVSAALQEQAGSSTTFVYKASEETTYNGTTYQAGDTILTA